MIVIARCSLIKAPLANCYTALASEFISMLSPACCLRRIRRERTDGNADADAVAGADLDVD